MIETFEIVVPQLFNTCKRPEKPNNYSVYIPKNDIDECQIYINGKWFTFKAITVDKTEENKEEKTVTDKEYKLIEAIRNLINEED